MKEKRMRFAGTWILLVAVFFCMFLPCEASNKKSTNRTVRIGCALTTGYHQNTAEGQITGYGYSYEQLLAQYAGWDIEYIDGTWMELQNMLTDGEIDLLGFLVKTEKREQVYDFSSLSAGNSMSCLAIKNGNLDFSYQDYESFHGMKIGCVRNNANLEAFYAYASENRFEVQLELFDTYPEVFEAIDSGSIDAGLVTSYQDLSNYTIIDQFLPVNYYYAVQKGNVALLNELDTAMANIDTFYSDIESSLYNQYYDRTNAMNVAFSKEELVYLKTRPVVTVIPCGRKAPYEIYDETTGTYEGIVPEILERIAEETGITFQYEHTEDRWVFETEKNTGNVITCFSCDPDWSADKSVQITQPFVESTVSVIQKEEPRGEVTVATQKGLYLEYLIKKEHPEWKLKYYDSKEECLDAVRKEECTSTVLNSYEADYYLSMGRYQALMEETMPGVIQNIGFGVTYDSDEELMQILSKAMLMISTNEYNAIIHANTNKTEKASFEDLLYTNPVQIIGLAVGILALILLSASLLIYTGSIRKKNQEIVEANQSKSTFLARMSHDMRTPLNGIKNYAMFIEEAESLEEAKDYAEKIHISENYLQTLINDTLGMSRIESGKVELKPEPYCYADFETSVRNVVEPKAKEKGVLLRFVSMEKMPQYVMFDKLRVQQIFVNILNNAIKFTPAGGVVELKIETKNQEDDTEDILFTIADTGIGMSQEFLENGLFKPFVQERQGKDNEETGTGLGLSIVKQLIELMGGSIECHSILGEGTTFYVTLPAKIKRNYKEADEEQEPADITLLQGKRILLFEDHPLNREIALRLLQKAGCTVDMAEDGAIGVQRFEKSEPGYYDEILMDVRMPNMDGLEATRVIRKMDRSDAGTIPIIAMTANAFAEDVEKCLEAGMNAHLAKPIEPQKMYETMKVQMQNHTNHCKGE